jgi:hypothetical protein
MMEVECFHHFTKGAGCKRPHSLRLDVDLSWRFRFLQPNQAVRNSAIKPIATEFRYISAIKPVWLWVRQPYALNFGNLFLKTTNLVILWWKSQLHLFAFLFTCPLRVTNNG